MAKIKQNIIILLLLSAFGSNAQQLVLGADRIDEILKTIDNKKIAVVANQTSRVNDVHLIDTLLSLQQKIISVFSPEHGFRGIEDAGAKIDNEIDLNTSKPEFIEWKWANLDDLPSIIVDFKKKLYMKLVPKIKLIIG